VRRCRQKSTGQMFAVKIVDITTETQSALDVERLMAETHDEIEILRELQGHSSIIELHDVYETTTFIFLIFEMAPLGELFDVLTKDVTFSEKRTKRCMRQILLGIQHMHSKNIMHRDIKLENILCIDPNRVVLTDFGFARKLNPGEHVKELRGTPGYLAPETLRAQMYEDAPGYGKEVDMWAAGVLMFTLIAGNAPFYHRKQMMMLRLIQEGKYEFRPEQGETVGNDAKDLIRNLLVVDPVQRFTAEQALAHPFLDVQMTIIEVAPKVRQAPRRLWRRAITCILFIVRLPRLRDTARLDRPALRKRPFRDRTIRHETEATVFAVFGHWVNKGFYESRDMLFANRPRPKIKRFNTDPPKAVA